MEGKAWARFSAFLERRGARLRAVAGWRNAVRRGVCCAVHSHPCLELVYHRKGSGITRLGTAPDLRFAEGGVVVYAPGEPHDQVMDGPGEDVCLQVEIPGMPRLAGALYVPPPVDPLAIAEIEALAGGQAWPPSGTGGVPHLRAAAAVLSLLHAGPAAERPAAPSRERRVAEAERYLRARYREIGSVDEVAGHVGLSPDRLRHLFRERRGASLVGFLAEVRMERARSLLRHSWLPVREVAALSGFRDEGYFSSAFRRRHRLSPRAFREKAQKEGAPGA